MLTDQIKQQSTELARRDTENAQTFAAFIDRLERLKRSESIRARTPTHQIPSSVALARQFSTAIGPAKVNTGSYANSQFQTRANSPPPQLDALAQDDSRPRLSRPFFASSAIRSENVPPHPNVRTSALSSESAPSARTAANVAWEPADPETLLTAASRPRVTEALGLKIRSVLADVELFLTLRPPAQSVGFLRIGLALQ